MSLVFHFDPDAVGVRMDGQSNRASCMDDGVGHELAHQQLCHIDDRHLHAVIGQSAADEDASVTNAGGPAQELNRTGH
jgi:hypothetical protein